MISVSLAAVVILAALLFGAVYSWSMAIVVPIAIATFIYFLWSTKDDTAEFSEGREVIIAALLLLSYPVLQLVPLPVSVLNLIHPKFKELLTIIPGEPPAFHGVSIYPFATEMEISRLFVYLAVFTVAAFGLKDKEDMHRVLKALVVFGFVLGVFAIIQKATWHGKLYWFKKPNQPDVLPFGPFVNRNDFAGFTNMLIPFSLGLALRARSFEKKVLFAFFGIAMTVSLFFSLSKGGIISFVAGMFIFSLIILAKGMPKRKLIPIALFSLVLAIYLLFLGVSPIVERFAHSEVSGLQRLEAWKGTLAAFRDYPFLGSGFGTFRYIFQIYQPEGLYLYWTHAHNDYLELLLELGVAGFIVVAFFLFTVLKIILKTEWKGRELYMEAALLASLTTIAVHSIVDFNLHIPSNALLFFLVLGVGISMSRLSAADNRRKWLRRPE